MKIVDAVWEERNLGVTCSEIRMEYTDSMESIRESYNLLEERQYMVVKMPSARYDMLHFLQDKGYHFSEVAVTLEHDLKSIDMPGRLEKICESCSWEMMTDDDIQLLHREIFHNIFKTDRVYTDPYFTRQQAAQRYDYWIQDLIHAGNTPYKVMYHGETIGFFLNKKVKDKIYDGLLAATYHEFEGTGMGYCIQYAGIKYAMQQGASKYIGHVSANNPVVLKVLLSIGFHVKEVEYVFIKHT